MLSFGVKVNNDSQKIENLVYKRFEISFISHLALFMTLSRFSSKQESCPQCLTLSCVSTRIGTPCQIR